GVQRAPPLPGFGYRGPGSMGVDPREPGAAGPAAAAKTKVYLGGEGVFDRLSPCPCRREAVGGQKRAHVVLRVEAGVIAMVGQRGDAELAERVVPHRGGVRLRLARPGDGPRRAARAKDTRRFVRASPGVEQVEQ